MATRKRFDHKAFVMALTDKTTSIRVPGGRIVVPGHAKTDSAVIRFAHRRAVITGTARVESKK